MRVLRTDKLIQLIEMERRIVRYPRANGQNELFLAAIRGCVFLKIGTRPNKAHVAYQYVEQLRQLINFVSPQESSDIRNPRVVLPGGYALAFGINAHGAEFPHRKRLAVLPDSNTLVEGGAFRIQSNRRSNYQKNRRQEQYPDSRNGDVDGAFHEVVEGAHKP